MHELYQQVQQQLMRVDFPAIWPGFHSFPFALYNKEHIWMDGAVLPWNDAFRGNTAIEYNGILLAIWYVENAGAENMVALAASLVHEMFHAFQREEGEIRFPNDLLGLSLPENASYFTLLAQEDALICAAFATSKAETKRSLLESIFALRQQRLAMDVSITHYTFAIETIEGCAEYCGTYALRQLDPVRFDAHIDTWLQHLQAHTYLFDIRRHGYASGFLLLLLLDALQIPFNRSIKGNACTIMDGLLASFPTKTVSPAIKSNDDSRIYAEYAEMLAQRQALFASFDASRPLKTEGSFRICGYDPMNIVRVGNRILHSHFVMLQNLMTQEVITLTGQAATTHSAEDIWHVDAYETTN